MVAAQLVSADTLHLKQAVLNPTADIIITRPSGANRLVIKAWGAGGAGGRSAPGGGGGFVAITYDLSAMGSSGQITLNFSKSRSGGAPGTGPGANYAGAGGMSLAVQTSFLVYGPPGTFAFGHVIAAAGGGGAGGHSSGFGGAGGASDGTNGGAGLGGSGGEGASGALYVRGSLGAPGSDNRGGLAQWGSGAPGGNYLSASTGLAGGGGGGGVDVSAGFSQLYVYGGSGGGGGTTVGGGGGGGGRSWIPANPLQAQYPALIVSSEMVAGAGQYPGRANDPDYPGQNVGFGGLGEAGGPSAIVYAVYTVSLAAPSAPAITSALSRTAVVGQSILYTITATQSPTSYSATPLPAGLALNATTGAISGVLTSAGPVNSTLGATNAAGSGQATLAWSIASDAAAPSIPSGLQARMLSSNSFRLTWTPSNDNVAVSAYEVKQDASILGTVGTTSQTVTGLQTGSTYSMSVRAGDAVGNWSAWSVPLSVQQTTVEPPTAPTALNYAERTDTSITMIWNASSGSFPIAGYAVYRGATQIATTSERVFTDTGLPVNTSQSYSVRAFDIAGNVSSASATLTVSTTQNTSIDADHGGVPDAMESVLGTNASSSGANDSSNQTQLKITRPPQ